jgi:RNA polymerase sigma-70 factor (subfamily 1)
VHELTDSGLIERAKAGDDGAFRALLERYRPRMRGRVLRRLSGPIRRKVSAADILQESELLAHERLAGFEDRGEGSFGHWLGRIVELKTRDVVKYYTAAAKRNVGREVSRAGADLPSRDPAHMETPSRLAMADEMQDRFADALRMLTAAQREALELLQEQNYTIVEAARRMGRSEGAIKKLHARALARLDEILNDES